MFAIYPIYPPHVVYDLPHCRSTQDMANVMMSCDQDVTTGLLLRGTGS